MTQPLRVTSNPRSAEDDLSSRRQHKLDQKMVGADHKWIADNDDDLPDELSRLIDALARAAARRDHEAASRGDQWQ